MKNLLICICCALIFKAQAQTVITRSYPVKAGTEINLKFDYPNVKISTWDKKEVSIVATIDPLDPDKKDYFELTTQEGNGSINIGDRVNFDKVPRSYYTVRNGVKTLYKTKEEYIEAKKNTGIQQAYEGNNIDITLEIKVPAGFATNIKATYGIVEVSHFDAPINVNATYGGIDAAVNTAQTGKIKATTQYGQILSNLDMKITAHEKRDFYNSITADAGNNKAACILRSDYGKIYLRKP